MEKLKESALSKCKTNVSVEADDLIKRLNVDIYVYNKVGFREIGEICKKKQVDGNAFSIMKDGRIAHPDVDVYSSMLKRDKFNRSLKPYGCKDRTGYYVTNKSESSYYGFKDRLGKIEQNYKRTNDLSGAIGNMNNRWKNYNYSSDKYWNTDKN